MSRLKTLAANQCGVPPLAGGHSLCQGCGIPIVVRTVLNSIPGRKVIVNATGCLEVATTRYPTTAWNVPWLHVAFENAAAVASGVESAQRALRRRHGVGAGEEVQVVVFAGDGGTYDIGLQALSGALERGHRLLFVCYDNEAYMNTGIQRSGGTPEGAWTMTTPSKSGSPRPKKDIDAIVAAHGPAYQATATPAFAEDMVRKFAKAKTVKGFRFLRILSPCPPGWKYDSEKTVAYSRLAVQTGLFPLWESEAGKFRLNYAPEKLKPVAEFLAGQGRYRGLSAEHAAAVQAETERRWAAVVARHRAG